VVFQVSGFDFEAKLETACKFGKLFLNAFYCNGALTGKEK
jgi:hypothetical protein